MSNRGGARGRSGYTAGVRRDGRTDPAVKLAVTLAVTLLLPPLGLLLIWRGRYPLRGKLILSLLATLSMTLMLSYVLSLGAPEPILPTPVPASSIVPVKTPEPDLAPANPVS